MKISNLKGRCSQINRLGVFYIWEPRVKKHLTVYGLQYVSIICIQTVNSWYEYNVYIAVKHIPDTTFIKQLNENIKIVKIVVKFDEKLKHIETSLNILLRENRGKQFDFIHSIPKSQLIFDARESHANK
jgi:hypothetical protein